MVLRCARELFLLPLLLRLLPADYLSRGMFNKKREKNNEQKCCVLVWPFISGVTEYVGNVAMFAYACKQWRGTRSLSDVPARFQRHQRLLPSMLFCYQERVFLPNVWLGLLHLLWPFTCHLHRRNRVYTKTTFWRAPSKHIDR